jgi:hypothetical protein
MKDYPFVTPSFAFCIKANNSVPPPLNRGGALWIWKGRGRCWAPMHTEKGGKKRKRKMGNNGNDGSYVLGGAKLGRGNGLP